MTLVFESPVRSGLFAFFGRTGPKPVFENPQILKNRTETAFNRSRWQRDSNRTGPQPVFCFIWLLFTFFTMFLIFTPAPIHVVTEPHAVTNRTQLIAHNKPQKRTTTEKERRQEQTMNHNNVHPSLQTLDIT
jgi:hypothetical protein